MQASERPRFRQDLFAEEVDEQGAKYVDVMDPDSGRVFRLYEVEFSIACAMDGERDVAGLVKWAQDELGVTPSASEVQTVISTLGELGYLDGVIAGSRAAATDMPVAPRAAASGLAGAGSKAADTLVETPPLSMPARTTIEVEDRTSRPAAAAAAPGSISEVSIDLTDHLPVGREELQEAVRQSRVMSAVEVPDELVIEPSEPVQAAAKPSKRPEQPTPRTVPVPESKPESKPAVAESKPAVVRTVPRAASEPSAAKQPAARPAAPVEAKQPAPPVEAKQPAPPVEVKQPAPPVEVKQPAPPVEVKQPPVEVKQPAPPVEVKQPAPPVEVKQPAPPVEVKQPAPPVEAKQPKQPVEAKPPVELPNVPEKQPVPPTAPPRRFSLVFLLIIFLVVGGAAFLVWKFMLNKPEAATRPTTGAQVQPQPAAPTPPPGPPPKKWVTSKIEMTAGKPKTILGLFAGKIDWIEAEGKVVQSNDIIMKLQGHRALEAEVASLTKEVARAQAEREAAFQTRDATPSENAAAFAKAEAKAQAADRVLNAKSDQLTRKSDQLEPLYVRLNNVEGTLQKVLKKVGDRIQENTPIAIIQPPPAPSATFKIPADYKTDVGVAAALKVGERNVTCEVGDWATEQLRVVCPMDQNLAEGTAVSYQLP